MTKYRITWKRQTETARDRQVSGFVAHCIGLLIETHQMRVKDIAKLAGLCTATVYRLKKGLASCHIEVATLQKLADATGEELCLRDIEHKPQVLARKRIKPSSRRRVVRTRKVSA